MKRYSYITPAACMIVLSVQDVIQTSNPIEMEEIPLAPKPQTIGWE